MKRTLITAALVATLAGCSAPHLQDGYQLGDFSATAVDGTLHVLTLQTRYCAESDPVARAILLRMIRVAVPGYPADGLCTNLLSVLEEDQANEIP